ncbi:hypothetical protein N780_03860 [Pontibacillus chungwhensis BH030062]|uniref:Uncharacterized protein n=1 Tax=Pontibacillus chungwhensis BH030062 TaxID=1385513 RepID=A0A0A2UQR4_9BACI|nr:hypothetical protein [Pontibacillus chungwhensis]KGP90652.1 hypothetical protein N780_03860 [Pontibacillus chungwhensis BH030062]
MRDHNNLKDEMKKLPSFEMDVNRKARNWNRIQSKTQKRNRNWFLYPLSVVAFLLMISSVTLLLMEEGPSGPAEQEWTATQKYFEGVEPIYSDFHLFSSLNLPDKRVALGYLYNASIFYTPESKRVNPLANHRDVSAYFQYTEEEMQSLDIEPKLETWKSNVKTTWVFLSSAEQLIQEPKLKEQISDLITKISYIHNSNPISENLATYSEVKEELAGIVREIKVTAKDTSIYKGKSENFELTIQELSDERHLAILRALNVESLDEEEVGVVSLSLVQSNTAFSIKVVGSTGYKENLKLPDSLKEQEEFEVIIDENETLLLSEVKSPYKMKGN